MKIKSFFYFNFWTFMTVMVLMIIAIIINVFTYMLNINHQNTAEEQMKYVANNMETAFEELMSISEFLANNDYVQTRIFTEYDKYSQSELVDDDRKVDVLFTTLENFRMIQHLNNVYVTGGYTPYVYRVLNRTYKDIYIYQFKEVELKRFGLVFLGIQEDANLEKSKKFRFVESVKEDNVDNYGLLYFEIDTQYFASLLNSGQKDTNMKFTLVDSKNEILYSQKPNTVGTVYEQSKDEKLILEHKLNFEGWKLYSETEKPSLTNLGHHMWVILGFASIIVILGAMVVVKNLNYAIIDPLLLLSQGMNRSRNGDLSTTITTTATGEVAQLVNDFNKMTKQLQLYMDKEVEDMRKLKDAEYKMLQVQINPHFMYNSLNAIKYIAQINGQSNIEEMIQNLWILLRNTSKIDGQEVTLKQEIEIIKAYVYLQKIRYKGKFTIEYNVDDEHQKYIIPKYILQPIIENAIFHGIAPKVGWGIIELSSELTDNMLYISVKDDGVGVTKEIMESILIGGTETETKGMTSIGLPNVVERMRILYKTQDVLEIYSELGKGTTMKLKFPLDKIMKE